MEEIRKGNSFKQAGKYSNVGVSADYEKGNLHIYAAYNW